MVMDDSNFRVSRSSVMPTTSTPAAAVAHLPVKSEETASSTITVNTTKNTNFPPPKTDKPRPHVCGTCQRSFARLEHLKRHERSHTKEKPFECPECSRCFARRDLLLRHQQKLHQTATPSSRPRNRRESAAAGSAAQSRARKNSVAGVAATNGNNAGNNNASMRPRANTISHVDNQHVQMIAAANANVARTMASGHGHGHSRHPSLIGLPMLDHTFGGMSTAMNHRGVPHGLKLETAQLSGDFNNNGLRTAPLTFTQEFDFEGMLFGPASTINPNALHYSDSPPSLAMEQASPYGTSLNETPSTAPFDDSFDWLTGFDHQMSFGNNENAVDGSSPSALSTTSQSGISDVMLDGSNHPAPAGTSSMWQPSVMGPPLSNPFAMDLSGSVFPDLLQGAPLSPQPATQKIHDPYLSAPPQSMSTLSPAAVQGQIHPPQNVTHHSQGFSSTNAVLETPSSVNSGNHGASPVTTITDATRDAIVTALNQCLPFGGRKYSVPSGSPSAPRGPSPSPAQQITSTLPSTQDLQRYVGAYIAYFHPHLPFIHIPTLSFNVASSGSPVGGSGCLMLSMAAIGALYEMEPERSLKIFDLAKKMIIFYLEGRRQVQARTADTRRASGSDLNTSYGAYESTSTPVWLVQAMLLNVVYGHNCGDKVAGDIASTHCAALVSLASAAELGRPAAVSGDQDIIMSNSNPWKTSEEAENQKWIQWKTMEERKRTQYGVFIMSSLLVTAYNHTPALTNSEVHLDLPCDEEFFNADSSTDFFAKGGVEAANHNQMTFHDALGDLLRTNERQHRQHLASPTAASQTLTDLKPSAFGSFVLINALHNYIWETRQRHHNKLWTNEETEKMHRHIEPALKAWQAAWANNPKHSRERPNPHGAGPLSADSIPLLDLAYVRLFVDLSSAKEKFWQRDYDGVADELAQGNQIVQHAEHSPGSNSESNGSLTSDATYHSPVFDESGGGSRSSFPTTAMNVSRRERHLRKAAFYAADALSASEKLGVNFADLTSRELRLQSAICASDYVQVLAEWIATLQDRVGPHLGILGQDVVDFSSMPAAAILEEDDVKLLQVTRELIETSEMKINIEQMAVDNGVPGGALMTGEGGYATRLLKFTSFLFGRDCIWPVMHLLATCLETQSGHMRHRADLSIRGRPQLGA